MRGKKKSDLVWKKRIFVYRCTCGRFHVESIRMHAPVAYVLHKYLDMYELTSLTAFLSNKHRILEEIEEI